MGFVYVIAATADRTERCKVGWSSRPQLRLETLRRECASALDLAAVFDVGEGMRVERRAHELLAAFASQVGNEWFDCSVDVSCAAVERALAELEPSDEEWALLATNPRGLGVDGATKFVDAWLKASRMDESRLGLLACANARAVSRVRSGTGSVESLRQLIEYIDAHPLKRLKS